MQVDVLPLGTGQGGKSIYDGTVCSSFVVRVGLRPVLLVDVGFGVTRTCLALAEHIPDCLFVSHNHSDHAGVVGAVGAGTLSPHAVPRDVLEWSYTAGGGGF